jgi:hypothetical protein
MSSLRLTGFKQKVAMSNYDIQGLELPRWFHATPKGSGLSSRPPAGETATAQGATSSIPGHFFCITCQISRQQNFTISLL